MEYFQVGCIFSYLIQLRVMNTSSSMSQTSNLQGNTINLVVSTPLQAYFMQSVFRHQLVYLNCTREQFPPLRVSTFLHQLFCEQILTAQGKRLLNYIQQAHTCLQQLVCEQILTAQGSFLRSTQAHTLSSINYFEDGYSVLTA